MAERYVTWVKEGHNVPRQVLHNAGEKSDTVPVRLGTDGNPIPADERYVRWWRTLADAGRRNIKPLRDEWFPGFRFLPNDELQTWHRT